MSKKISMIVEVLPTWNCAARAETEDFHGDCKKFRQGDENIVNLTINTLAYFG
jgi:hypothetical protein